MGRRADRAKRQLYSISVQDLGVSVKEFAMSGYWN